jgi:glycosyltransferase involved in cell wall biosynthesis
MTPRFSVVTPVYNTNKRDLEECIASVLDQTFGDWELCLIDDKSPKNYVRKTLARAAAVDSRIKVMHRNENGGIVAASNDGLAMARGEFVALLDHDDVIEPDALQLVNELLLSDSEIDYLYTDETLMTEKGAVVEHFHKPGWSPERFRHQMYVCHLSVIRRELALAVGGFRTGYDGSQDYDLMFRVTENTRKVGHVPKLLYHWRMATTSVANNASAKPYAYDAGKRAIEAHLERTEIGADVERLVEFPGNYRVTRRPSVVPTVDVFVPDSGLVDMVWGLERRHHDSTVSDLGKSPGMAISVCELSHGGALTAQFNKAVLSSNAELVVLVSEALEPSNEGWASELTQPFTDQQIGIVSGFTYSANSRLQHAGYYLHGSFLDRSHFRIGHQHRGQRAQLETIHEVSAVDWQCMAVRRDLFEQLGGFDESLDHPWVTVDFCLRAAELGYRTVVTPRAEFLEFTNNDDFAWYRTRAPKAFRQKWQRWFDNDPYRPRPPLQRSAEAERPYWQPKRLRDFASARRR